MSDDDSLPYVRGSDTSRDAAESMAGEAGAIRERIFRQIERAPIGLTCDEVEVRLSLRHQTASARIRELVQAGRIHDTRERRFTRSGRNAAVYRITTATEPPRRQYGDLFDGI